ncbi:aspartyl/asparaginyl beta-hydroxylase domain-containing protein [Streptomyces sp. NPDC085929]|uniref:aspartyl/asparaginyl beta-hydroxylase domain-containing protein n=1 Tax=Streptomyces sp. NPDC085929 TaxID=3365739 RepID=UPI0037D93991
MPSTPLPPAAACLNRSLDVARLAADLAQVTGHTWDLQQGRAPGGLLGTVTDIDWRVLPLIAPNGDADRTDPGGPGPDTYAPTGWLDRMPYLAEVLAAIPAPLNAARLMALGPNAVGERHSDPKYSLARGCARLHIPLTTNPDAVLYLDGTEHTWQPAEFWYGDFSREHAVRNLGTTTRVHAVIDTLFTIELAALFPLAWQEQLADADALINHPTPLDRTIPAGLPRTLHLPAGFTDFSRDQPLDGDPTTAELDHTADHLTLTTAERTFALLPAGPGEWRFSAWSEARTLAPTPDGGAVLHARHGRTHTHRTLTAATA